LAHELPQIPGARIVPVDANAYFARPGPRYVDGIELLARIFHGEDA
jgi:iron complex transport system substrate-binding protein